MRIALALRCFLIQLKASHPRNPTVSMRLIQVYDPPMCCSTGICGPSVDPILPIVTGMLYQMGRRGVKVERQNLSQQPMAFVQNPVVRDLLKAEGEKVLPLIFVDGELRLKGRYPDLAEREAWMREVITEAREESPSA